MLEVLKAARKAGLRVFYAPHRRYRPGDYESLKHIAPVQKAVTRYRNWVVVSRDPILNTPIEEPELAARRRAQSPSHRGLQPQPHLLEPRGGTPGAIAVGIDADYPLSGGLMTAIWATTVLHRGATPSFSGGSKGLLRCPVTVAERKGLPRSAC